MIETLIILATGYGVTSRERSGMEDLHGKLLASTANQAGTFAIWPLPWNHDAKGLAMRTMRNLSPDGRIIAAGHSWASRFITDYFARLYHMGIVGDHAFMADPIYCGRLWGLRGLQALWSGSTITVRNCRNVTYWLQRRDYPRGHAIRAGDESTTVHPPYIVQERGHAEMDSYRPFHEAVIAASKEPRND